MTEVMVVITEENVPVKLLLVALTFILYAVLRVNPESVAEVAVVLALVQSESLVHEPVQCHISYPVAPKTELQVTFSFVSASPAVAETSAGTASTVRVVRVKVVAVWVLDHGAVSVAVLNLTFIL